MLLHLLPMTGSWTNLQSTYGVNIFHGFSYHSSNEALRGFCKTKDWLFLEKNGKNVNELDRDLLKVTVSTKILQNMNKASVADPDRDPCVSVLKLLPWIRIRICMGSTDPAPNPRQSKWRPKRKKNLRFLNCKEKELFCWRPDSYHLSLSFLNKGLHGNLWLQYYKFIFEKNFLTFLSWKNLGQNPDPEPDPDPDPHWPKLLDPDLDPY